MIADVLAGAPPRAGRRAPLGGTVAVLARREAWRMLRHPVLPVLLGYFLLLSGLEAADAPSGGPVRHVLLMLGSFWIGPASFLAANLVASSARRARAEAQLAAAPTDRQARTLALCLGVLGPAAVGVVLALALRLLERGGHLLPTRYGELAGIPLYALGGGLLGIAVAQWLPWRGAALAVLLALIAWVVVLLDRGDLRWLAPWSMAPEYGTVPAGSAGWHAAYLLGLGGLAAGAALLRDRGRRRPLLAGTAVLLAATVVAGWAQLS